MISYHRFVELLHELFLSPIFLDSSGFTPSHSTSIDDFSLMCWERIHTTSPNNINGKCVWWHEEPLNSQDLDNLQWIELLKNQSNVSLKDYPMPPGQPACWELVVNTNFQIFANSEISQLKKNWIKQSGYLDWYFFFHGFASLYWYNDFKYLRNSEIKISKVFMCLNHIINNNRSYRLYLLSNLKSHNLTNHGFISAPLLSKELIKKELYNKDSQLSTTAKKHIHENLLPEANPIFLDHDTNYDYASADIIDSKFSYGSMWHVVTETVFYENKLHLTEKIFKPIVIGRPFLLISSVGNLSYLKRYGFKTFDRWIDESYDNEPDPDIRLLMIVEELNKLCNMSEIDLMNMYKEMQPILEYNKEHFFGNFKEILVDELIDNFKKCVFLYNKDLSERFRVPEQNLDYNYIKKILLS
jgi:hypothetical protein